MRSAAIVGYCEMCNAQQDKTEQNSRNSIFFFKEMKISLKLSDIEANK
jgi:hypothetical protein